MTTTQLFSTIRAVFVDSYKWHCVTLAMIVESAFRTRRLTITSLGRELAVEGVPKHAIKRVDRWMGNRRFDDKKAREQFLRWVVGPRRHVLIAIDWTKLRRWPVLVAGVVHRGRAIPVLWAVADPARLYKSQNAFEHGFIAWLRAALPDGVQATLLLDRGFKRVDLIARLRGFSFVIRTGGNVHIHSRSFHGRADQLIRRRGVKCDLPDAVLRPSRPVRVRIVGTWAKPCKEPWILMTDLDLSVDRIVALYAKRFRIEESFRDQKDWRYGLQAGHTLVLKAARLERLLLVASLVLFLAILAGAAARRSKLDRGFRANTLTVRPTHSDFALGLYYALRRRWNRMELLAIFYEDGATA